MKKRGLALIAALVLAISTGVGFAQSTFDVAIFFPGILGGNPLEPPITAGVERARAELPNVTVRVVEGGNASDWESGIVALTATGTYELIITFTDGMPQILQTVTAMFPDQKYALLDSAVDGLPTVYSLTYSDEALGFVGGVFAGLLATNFSLSGNPEEPSVGLLAGTPYPQMDNKIHPGYAAGAHYVDPDIEVLFAVVGSWNDPNRARDLALNMYNRGTTAIMSITGGGDPGVHRAASETGRFAIAVNTDQNAMMPGVVLGSVLKRLDNSIFSVVEAAMDGTLPYGTTETAGVREGAISIADDALYRDLVPQSTRDALDEVMAGIASGTIDLEALLSAELGN